MGTMALGEALSVPGISPRINQIVLAAPDIDLEVFETQLAPAITGRAPTTLYASANDSILSLSKMLQKGPRAGDIRDGVVVLPGMDTIDASNVSTWFGHSDYGDVRTIVDDMSLLLRGKRPPERNLIQRPHQRGAYWEFAK